MEKPLRWRGDGARGQVSPWLLAALAWVLLVGCASVPSDSGYPSWYRSGGGTEAEFQADRSQCLGAATEMVWTGTRRSGPRQMQLVNEDAYLECMQQRGWVLRDG